MKANRKVYKTLYIEITTYKTINKGKKVDKNMNSGSLDKRNKSHNKFICSICLNQRFNDDKRSELNNTKSRSCPLCHCSCSNSTDDDSTLSKRPKQFENLIDKTEVKENVQSSHAVSQGLTLLNEVLNVFQSKKQSSNSNEKRNRTIIYKDIGVSTEDIVYRNVKPKLSKSKTFQFSIQDNYDTENKFTIVSSTQPETIKVSRKSLDLINHKSSSIPQMKLEELKQSLKTKTKSKDAIEEANRMFATVKRIEENNCIDNRPMIRSGPRVLPVVKTGYFEVNNDAIHKNAKVDETRKPCHGNDYHMSGGDSSIKNKCPNCKASKESEDDSNNMCCHYQRNRQPTKEFICKRCRMTK